MIAIEEFCQALNLEPLTQTTRKEMDINVTDLNRPGMQFCGFYEFFAAERPQVIGKVEMTYLESIEPTVREKVLRRYMSYDLPCIVCCWGMTPPKELLQIATERDIPVFMSRVKTTKFTLQAIMYLNRVLAPHVTRHGVLVDVYGVGVLLTGESGVGKSEAALELVKRGHQLAADDVVDICRVSDDRLVGEAPEMVRHFMEIRGIGIIDIVENRLIGMKDHGIYETPGGTILYFAHAQLEMLTMDKEVMHEKQKLAVDYADLLYNGKWYSPLQEALTAFANEANKDVTGSVKLKLYKGNIIPAGMTSPCSLYSENLVTFGESDYDQGQATGFINLWGLTTKMQALKEQGKL